MKTPWQVKSYTSSLGETGDHFTESWIENGELKLIASSDLESDEELYEIANALNSFESLDQQNKEKDAEIQRLKNDFNEAVTIAQANRNEIQRLTKERDETVAEFKRITNDKSFTSIVSEWREQQAELTRLREEVEELKNDLLDALDLKNGNGPTALTMLSNEITRLRELLGRASQYIQVYGMGGDTAKQLLTDIDNGLNPKP